MSLSYRAAVVQAAPVFMDLSAGVDKAVRLIAGAAQQGASIIAFPECWLPGYPWWAWLSTPAHNIRYFQRYHEHSVVVDSAAFDRIAEAAEQHNIFVSMGASERDQGSLYIAQFLFDNHGDVVQTRRKLKPTHVERTIYGEGDGSDLDVLDTSLGRIGQLCCWEHMQPLTKYAMFSMHEQLHIAAWPSFSSYPDAYALSGPLNNALSQVYAAEGQCFVLAPCGMVSQAMYDLMVDTDEQAALIEVGGGYAQIYGPDGRPLCEPLAHTEEGLLFADIDLGVITIAKSFADPVGHYSRPDVTRLLLNREPQPTVENFDSTLTDDSDAADDDLDNDIV